LPNIESKEELLDILELLYRINKHSLMLPSHHPETEAIVHKNMRMGIGMTGILQASAEQNSWLDEGYEYLRTFDKEYSEQHGMNESVKLTTVKPSGTLSLLPGVTPGIHPAYAQYMYRRIRIAADNSLVEVCRRAGYPIEYVRRFDGTEEYGTVVVTFPFSYPEGTKLASEMTALDQLREIKRLQSVWSDNSVSCTIYYKKEEISIIKEYLKHNYRNSHKSLSFLLHSEHGFAQAPYEEITKEQYDELVGKTEVIGKIANATFESNDECTTGACPIR
jgi:ribonucleoside-triphosphate reductase